MTRIILASSIGDSFAKVSGVFDSPIAQQKIVAITTAANPYAPEKRGYLARDAQPMLDAGATLTTYDIAGKSEAEVRVALADADIIYVCGGNSFYLLDQMKRCGFATVLNEAFARGAWYMGSSAGAVVACPDIGFISPMDDPAASTLTTFEALGLVDFKLVPHADHARHGAAAQAILADFAAERPAIVGLNDNQALVITGGTVSLR